MEIDIQQPLRSAEFSISPAADDTSETKGFNHFGYTFNHVAGGENKLFEIAYSKQDRLPSVDIKYSRMSGDKVWGSPYDTQRHAKKIIYIVFITGVIGLATVIGWLFFYRRKQRV